MGILKINILTPQTPFRSGFNDFYPIIRWRKEFKAKEIQFKFYSHHFNENLFKCDILIIDYRYFQLVGKQMYKLPRNKKFNNDTFILDVISKARQRVSKIVLFDSSDGGGSACFHITPYVDLHLKKQIYKNRERYLSKQEYNFMPWLPKGKGITESKKLIFTPLSKQDEKKLKIGWNIGLCDYSDIPFKNRVPSYIKGLLPGFITQLKTYPPSYHRKYLLSYRGTSNRFPSYDYQRNLASKSIRNIGWRDIISGGVTKYSKYMREQQESIVGLSPFGWGEICYRDFEIFKNGSILVKPSVEHLITYPNLFKENETYIPLAWDLSDLVSQLNWIKENYKEALSIAENGQKFFIDTYNSPNSFINQFQTSVID